MENNKGKEVDDLKVNFKFSSSMTHPFILTTSLVKYNLFNVLTVSNQS